MDEIQTQYVWFHVKRAANDAFMCEVRTWLNENRVLDEVTPIDVNEKEVTRMMATGKLLNISWSLMG